MALATPSLCTYYKRPTRLPIPKGVPEWLTSLASIVPAQLFTYQLARAKGYDTESPRSIRKVTETH